jgi:dCMP deaminase
MATRTSWDEYFMEIARTVAKRSTCDRAQVGAVLVRDHRILTTGYNGALPGQYHCDEIGHFIVDGHCVRTVHAEANAVVQAALHGISTKGATAYVTHFPCINCTKLLIAAGVKILVYGESYRDIELAWNFFKKSDVKMVRVGDKN